MSIIKIITVFIVIHLADKVCERTTVATSHSLGLVISGEFSTVPLASPCPVLTTTGQSQTPKVCHVDIFNTSKLHYGRPKITIYLPFISKGVSSHLSGHALLIEGSQLAFIVHFNQLLAASGGERDV